MSHFVRLILPLCTRPLSYSRATITVIGYEPGLSETQHTWLRTANLYTENSHSINKPYTEEKSRSCLL